VRKREDVTDAEGDNCKKDELTCVKTDNFDGG